MRRPIAHLWCLLLPALAAPSTVHAQLPENDLPPENTVPVRFTGLSNVPATLSYFCEPKSIKSLAGPATGDPVKGPVHGLVLTIEFNHKRTDGPAKLMAGIYSYRSNLRQLTSKLAATLLEYYNIPVQQGLAVKYGVCPALYTRSPADRTSEGHENLILSTKSWVPKNLTFPIIKEQAISAAVIMYGSDGREYRRSSGLEGRSVKLKCGFGCARLALGDLATPERPGTPSAAAPAIASMPTRPLPSPTSVSTTTSPGPTGSPLATVPPAPTVAPGRRVALVIGNGAYAHVSALPNPRRDAEAIAQMLRRVGFAEVRTLVDADHARLTGGLKSFGDLAEGSDWAMVYFAGHGIELGGTPFLIPVDAKLERDTHVRDEAVALDRVLEKVASARKLRIVVLDACRNNPFAARMTRTTGATRSVDRGLSRIEPDGDVLVAYSAKHGTVAEDGTGAHSPFVTALLEQIPQPGVDIRIMFGRVRDAVRRATGNRQEPYLYGSVGGESHMFMPTAR